MLWNGKSYGWCWGIYRARGMPIGVVSGLRRNTPLGVVLRAASLIGLSIPVCYVGVLPLIALSLYRRDHPIVQAAITVFTLAVMRVNLIVDVLYGWIDRSRAR
jgi:ABC-type dipeptide/oligopeptide/nickel transport system permease component